MNKKEIKQSIISTCGGELVSVAEVVKWSGRSVEWVREHLLRGLPYVRSQSMKVYYAGDIAAKICEISEIDR